MRVSGANRPKRTRGALMRFLPSGVRYYVLFALVKILSFCPFELLYALSDVLFFPFYFVIRYRRKIVRKNLTESFPDKSMDEIVRIEKEFYHFFLDMSLESCKLLSITPEEMRRRMKFTHTELVNEMLLKGHSISIFLGHYGNWEWLSSIGLWLDKNVVVAQVYRKLHNKAMDKIMRKLRGRMGNRCVEMRKTVRFMAEAATDSRAYMLGFIADQSPKRREAKHFIPFLNHRIPVLTGTEKATKHYGYSALFMGMKRTRRGYYECTITPLHDHPESLPDFELTTLYFQRLEHEIRQHPALYLWTHNRFKYAVAPDESQTNKRQKHGY